MEIYPGIVVESLAGRDKNKYFVVLNVLDDKFCHIADGGIRKVDAPKKKKMKHLRCTEHSVKNVTEKLNAGETVTNSMIKKELKAVIDNQGC